MVRLVTAKALGMICDVKAVAPLIRLLKKKDLEVMGTVVKALGKIGDSRAVAPLIKILDSKESQHHPAVVKALGKIGDKRAVESLERLLKYDEAAMLNTYVKEVQQAALKALNRFESIE
jgi:HEAT repeat protein